MLPLVPAPPGATGGGSNNIAAARAAVRFFCWSSEIESSPLGDPPGHEVASWEMSTGYNIHPDGFQQWRTRAIVSSKQASPKINSQKREL